MKIIFIKKKFIFCIIFLAILFIILFCLVFPRISIGVDISKDSFLSEESKNKIENLSKDNEKIAYLTFDDGPTKNITPKILDILKEENVKATFFVVGKNVDSYPEIVKRAYDEGHFIANHGYDHNNKNLYKNDESFLNEIEKTDIAIGNAIDIPNYCSHIFRFPTGFKSPNNKKKKEHAALISFLCLFIFCSAQNAYLTQMNLLDEAVGNGQNLMLGFQIVDMGVFLGIVIGVVVGLLYNKYCDKDLGEVLSVYGGTKFVFLISIPIMLALAILFVYIWPPVQNLITSVATFISTSGGVGYFTFGFLERLLIPTGLHHLLGSAVWYTDLGGVATVAGKEYVGSWAIALAQLSDPCTAKLSLVTIFNNVTLCKLFGLTGAGLAMLSCAKPSMKNKAKAIYIPAILSSCLAAIT